MEKKNKKQKEEIDFHSTFGLWPFKKSLDVTPAGFLYCGELFPLNTVTRLRWGIDQRRGGLFPKLTYIAAFGTETREVVIKTKQKDFYEVLTQRFWRAAGKRLMVNMLCGLRAGKEYRFGDFTVSDAGITTAKRGVIRRGPKEFYKWEDLKWGIINGSVVFTLGASPDKPITSASFLWVDNVHILSVALALLQDTENKDRLSSIATP